MQTTMASNKSKPLKKRSRGINALPKPSQPSNPLENRVMQKEAHKAHKNPILSKEPKTQPKTPQRPESRADSKAPTSPNMAPKKEEPMLSHSQLSISFKGPYKSGALRSVSGEHTFKLANGKELSNLLDLAHSFEEMADETFFHHSNDAKNDFSNWIRDIFELEDLSNSLRAASKEESKAKVYRHLLQELMR